MLRDKFLANFLICNHSVTIRDYPVVRFQFGKNMKLGR